MANELIINASLPETRIALMEDGEIQELLIERASGKGIVGNIYKGRVTRVLPGMQAAFVDIGLEKAAFLYVDDVYVHSEIWEEEEGSHQAAIALEDVHASEVERALEPVGEVAVSSVLRSESQSEFEVKPTGISSEAPETNPQVIISSSLPAFEQKVTPIDAESEWNNEETEYSESDFEEDTSDDLSDDSPHDSDDDEPTKPVKMAAKPSSSGGEGGSKSSSDQPPGTVAPETSNSEADSLNLVSQGSDSPVESSVKSPVENPGENSVESPVESNDDSQDEGELAADGEAGDSDAQSGIAGRKRHRRGRRGGRYRRRVTPPEASPQVQQSYPENYHEQVADAGASGSDRSGLVDEANAASAAANSESNPLEVVEPNRPEAAAVVNVERRPIVSSSADRPEFKAPRSRDRRIRTKTSSRPVKAQVNIQDLLKEGQEVLVQVAKDPIATKGARLTCHISLPGRHLVCMPTIDHVGVSRRIERDDERRRLREFVERNRPRNLGFIVRTASGKQQSERRIKQDIDYLTHLWTEIREKAASITAPALVYEDLNSVLRAIRDWVTEEIDKVIVDSRYHYNEIQRFVSHFMPSLKQKVELYHGDIPIFDAYGISTELSRALERKVWLKSGGYIVIDQAEALVAIDVNTGRYVGKKNLEDTILKTNLEAVQEIAYQLRLRNSGGIIILDLIDMEKDENKQRVYRALEDALSRDRARPTILKISELGLVEMTRKRTRDTIVRTLCESCTHCEGKGFIKGKLTVGYEVMREIEREGIERDVSKILVQAHPDVIDILAIDERETLDQLERRYRKQIYLQAVTDFHPEQFEVTADKREKSERGKDGREYTVMDRSQDHSSNRHRARDRDQDRERDRERNTQVPTPIAPVYESTATVIIKPAAPQVIEPVASSGVTLLPNPLPAPVVSVRNSLENSEVSKDTPEGVAQGAAQGTATQKTDEFFDEEDRLAFLRAQAAQDAALARLGSGAGGHPSRTSGEMNHRGPNGAAGRRGVRGRRGPGGSPAGGGKFRRGGGVDRNRDRGGVKPYGYTAAGGPPHIKRNEPAMKDAGAAPLVVSGNESPVRTASSGSGNEGSNGNSGGNSGGGAGAGGDQSQPPV